LTNLKNELLTVPPEVIALNKELEAIKHRNLTTETIESKNIMDIIKKHEDGTDCNLTDTTFRFIHTRLYNRSKQDYDFLPEDILFTNVTYFMRKISIVEDECSFCDESPPVNSVLIIDPKSAKKSPELFLCINCSNIKYIKGVYMSLIKIKPLKGLADTVKQPTLTSTTPTIIDTINTDTDHEILYKQLLLIPAFEKRKNALQKIGVFTEPLCNYKMQCNCKHRCFRFIEKLSDDNNAETSKSRNILYKSPDIESTYIEDPVTSEIEQRNLSYLNSNSCYYIAVNQLLRDFYSIHVNASRIIKFHTGQQQDAHEYLSIFESQLPKLTRHTYILCICGIIEYKEDEDLSIFDNCWESVEHITDHKCSCGISDSYIHTLIRPKKIDQVVININKIFRYSTLLKQLIMIKAPVSPKALAYVSYSGSGSFGHYEYNKFIGYSYIEVTQVPESLITYDEWKNKNEHFMILNFKEEKGNNHKKIAMPPFEGSETFLTIEWNKCLISLSPSFTLNKNDFSDLAVSKLNKISDIITNKMQKLARLYIQRKNEKEKIVFLKKIDDLLSFFKSEKAKRLRRHFKLFKEVGNINVSKKMEMLIPIEQINKRHNKWIQYEGPCIDWYNHNPVVGCRCEECGLITCLHGHLDHCKKGCLQCPITEKCQTYLMCVPHDMPNFAEIMSNSELRAKYAQRHHTDLNCPGDNQMLTEFFCYMCDNYIPMVFNERFYNSKGEAQITMKCTVCSHYCNNFDLCHFSRICTVCLKFKCTCTTVDPLVDEHPRANSAIPKPDKKIGNTTDDVADPQNSDHINILDGINLDNKKIDMRFKESIDKVDTGHNEQFVVIDNEEQKQEKGKGEESESDKGDSPWDECDDSGHESGIDEEGESSDYDENEEPDDDGSDNDLDDEYDEDVTEGSYWLTGSFFVVKTILNKSSFNIGYGTIDKEGYFMSADEKFEGLVSFDAGSFNLYVGFIKESDWVEEKTSYTRVKDPDYEEELMSSLESDEDYEKFTGKNCFINSMQRLCLINAMFKYRNKNEYIMVGDNKVKIPSENIIPYCKEIDIDTVTYPPYELSELIDVPLTKNDLPLEEAEFYVKTEINYMFINRIGYKYAPKNVGYYDENNVKYFFCDDGAFEADFIYSFRGVDKRAHKSFAYDSSTYDVDSRIKLYNTIFAKTDKVKYNPFVMRHQLANLKDCEPFDRVELDDDRMKKYYVDNIVVDTNNNNSFTVVSNIKIVIPQITYYYRIISVNSVVLLESSCTLDYCSPIIIECDSVEAIDGILNVSWGKMMLVLTVEQTTIEVINDLEAIIILFMNRNGLPYHYIEDDRITYGSEEELVILETEDQSDEVKKIYPPVTVDDDDHSDLSSSISVIDIEEHVKDDEIEEISDCEERILKTWTEEHFINLICKFFSEKNHRGNREASTIANVILGAFNDYDEFYELPPIDEDNDKEDVIEKDDTVYLKLKEADYMPDSLVGVPIEIKKYQDPILTAPIQTDFRVFDNYHDNLTVHDKCCVCYSGSLNPTINYRAITSILFDSLKQFNVNCVVNNLISYNNVLASLVNSKSNLSYQNDAVDIYFKLRHDIFAAMVIKSTGRDFTGTDINIKEKFGINTMQTPDDIIQIGAKLFVLEYSVTGSYERGLVSKGKEGFVVKGKYDDLIKQLTNKTGLRVLYYPIVLGLDKPAEFIEAIPEELNANIEILKLIDVFLPLFKQAMIFIKRCMPLSLEYQFSKVKIPGKKFINYLPMNDKDAVDFNFKYSSRLEHVKALQIIKYNLKNIKKRLSGLNKELSYEMAVDIKLRTLDFFESQDGLRHDALDALLHQEDNTRILEKVILLKNRSVLEAMKSSKFSINIKSLKRIDRGTDTHELDLGFKKHPGTVDKVEDFPIDEKVLPESNYNDFLKTMLTGDPNDFDKRITDSIINLSNTVDLDTGKNCHDLIAMQEIKESEVKIQLSEFSNSLLSKNDFSRSDKRFRVKNPFLMHVSDCAKSDEGKMDYHSFAISLLNNFKSAGEYTRDILGLISSKEIQNPSTNQTTEKIEYMMQQKGLMINHIKLKKEMSRLGITKIEDIGNKGDDDVKLALDSYNNLKTKIERDYYRQINVVLSPEGYDLENPFLNKQKRMEQIGFAKEGQGLNKNLEEVYTYTDLKSEMVKLMDYLTTDLGEKQCNAYDDSISIIDGQTNCAIKDEIKNNARSIKSRVEQSRIAAVCKFIQEFCYVLSYYSTNNVSNRHVMFDSLGYSNVLLLCKGGKLSQNKQASKLHKIFYPVSEVVANFITGGDFTGTSFIVEKIDGRYFMMTPWMELNNTLMMDGFSAVSKVVGGHILTYLEQKEKKDLDEFMTSQAMRSILFLHNRRNTESTLHSLRYITMSLLGKYSGALKMLESFAMDCVDKIQAYICLSIEENYLDFYNCLDTVKKLGRQQSIKSEYKSKLYIIDMFNDRNHYTNLQDFTEIIYYKYMMSKAPIVSINEQINNAVPVLESVKLWKSQHDKYNFDDILDSTNVDLTDNFNDMMPKLSDNHMYCKDLAYYIGKTTADLLSGVTNQSTITNEYKKIFDQTILTLASGKGMRTDVIDKSFFGQTGYEVTYDIAYEKNDGKFFTLVEEYLKMNVSDVKFGQAIDKADITRSSEIKSIIKDNWGEIYFHVVPKLQWGGSREIYVMNYKSKLFTSTMEEFYKYLCKFLPNEQISVPSNKRFKVIHQKIVEKNELPDSKKFFITMDCRRWGPEANLTKYVMFMFGMKDILPAEFLETFTYFFSKYFGKKYIFRKEVIDGLRKNKTYIDEKGEFLYDFLETEYEEKRDIEYYVLNSKVHLMNKSNNKFLTEDDREKMLSSYKGSIHSKKGYHGFTDSKGKNHITKSNYFNKEDDDFKKEFIKNMSNGINVYSIQNNKSSAESVQVPFGFVMGMFNYLSSMFHAASQLYFKHLIESIYPKVRFHAIAHSDDSGAKIECYSEKLARKVFYIYEIFQKACGHILSPKKTVFSRIYFEFVSVLYIGSVCLPASQKRLWQIKYNPSAEGYAKDAINGISIQIDLISNGCSHSTAYIASLIYQNLVDRFYISLLRIISGVRDHLPVELFGKIDELPIYTLLMGTQANSMRHIKYGNLEKIKLFGYFMSNPFISDTNVGVFKAPRILPTKRSEKINNLIEKWESKLSAQYLDNWTLKNCKFNKVPLDIYWYHAMLKNPSFYSSIMADSEIKRWRRSFTAVRHRKWVTAYGSLSDAKTILLLCSSLLFAYEQQDKTNLIDIEINGITVLKSDLEAIMPIITENTSLFNEVTKNHEILYAECYKLDEALNMRLLNLNTEKVNYSTKPVSLYVASLLMAVSIDAQASHLAGMVINRNEQQIILSQNRPEFLTQYKSFYAYLGAKVDKAKPEEIYALADMLTQKNYKSFYMYAYSPDTKKISSYNKYSTYLANNIMCGKYYPGLDIPLTIRSTQLTRHEMCTMDINCSINTELCLLSSDMKDDDLILADVADYKSGLSKNFRKEEKTWQEHVEYMTNPIDFNTHISKSYLYLMYLKKTGKNITNTDLAMSTYYYYEKEQKLLYDTFVDEGLIKGSNMGVKFEITVFDYDAVEVKITNTSNDNLLSSTLYYINYILAEAGFNTVYQSVKNTYPDDNELKVGYTASKDKVTIDKVEKLFWHHDKISVVENLDVISDFDMTFYDNPRINRLTAKGVPGHIRLLPEILVEKRYTPEHFSNNGAIDEKIKISNNLTNLSIDEKVFMENPDCSLLYASIYNLSSDKEHNPISEIEKRLEDNDLMVKSKHDYTVYNALVNSFNKKTGEQIDLNIRNIKNIRERGFIESNPASVNYIRKDTRESLAEIFYKNDATTIRDACIKSYTAFLNSGDRDEMVNILQQYGLIGSSWAVNLYGQDPIEKEIQLLLHTPGEILKNKFYSSLYHAINSVAKQRRIDFEKNIYPNNYMDSSKLNILDDNLSSQCIVYCGLKGHVLLKHTLKTISENIIPYNTFKTTFTKHYPEFENMVEGTISDLLDCITLNPPNTVFIQSVAKKYLESMKVVPEEILIHGIKQKLQKNRGVPVGWEESSISGYNTLQGKHLTFSQIGDAMPSIITRNSKEVYIEFTGFEAVFSEELNNRDYRSAVMINLGQQLYVNRYQVFFKYMSVCIFAKSTNYAGSVRRVNRAPLLYCTVFHSDELEFETIAKYFGLERIQANYIPDVRSYVKASQRKYKIKEVLVPKVDKLIQKSSEALEYIQQKLLSMDWHADKIQTWSKDMKKAIDSADFHMKKSLDYDSTRAKKLEGFIKRDKETILRYNNNISQNKKRIEKLRDKRDKKSKDEVTLCDYSIEMDQKRLASTTELVNSLTTELNKLNEKIHRPWDQIINEALNDIVTSENIDNFLTDTYTAEKINAVLEDTVQSSTFDAPIETVYTLGTKVLGFGNKVPWYRKMIRDSRVRSELSYFIDQDNIDKLTSGVSMLTVNTARRITSDIHLRAELCLSKGMHKQISMMWILSTIINSMNFRTDVPDPLMIENIDRVLNSIDKEIKIKQSMKYAAMPEPRKPPDNLYKLT